MNEELSEVVRMAANRPQVRGDKIRLHIDRVGYGYNGISAGEEQRSMKIGYKMVKGANCKENPRKSPQFARNYGPLNANDEQRQYWEKPVDMDENRCGNDFSCIWCNVQRVIVIAAKQQDVSAHDAVDDMKDGQKPSCIDFP